MGDETADPGTGPTVSINMFERVQVCSIMFDKPCMWTLKYIFLFFRSLV